MWISIQLQYGEKRVSEIFMLSGQVCFICGYAWYFRQELSCPFCTLPFTGKVCIYKADEVDYERNNEEDNELH